MVQPVYAATEPLSNLYQPGAALGGSGATIANLLTPIIQNILILLALASFIFILFAGFNYITSQGDKGKVEQATNMLNYAIVGLVLAVAAYVLTQIVFRVGGIQNIFAPGI